MTDQPDRPVVAEPSLPDQCLRCRTTDANGVCCQSHNALLCHRCYRTTHFVEVCIAGCEFCAREGLPVVMTSGGTK